MKKFNFPLERMLNYQEQNLEKERGIMSRLLAARTGLEEKRLRLMEEMEEIQSERGKEIRKGTTFFPAARPQCCWSAGRTAGEIRKTEPHR